MSSKVSHLMKTWAVKDQEWTKLGLEKEREAYERMEKEVEAAEDFSLDRASKIDIVLETADSSLHLAEQAQTFQTHLKFVNSDAVGSTQKNSNFQLHFTPS